MGSNEGYVEAADEEADKEQPETRMADGLRQHFGHRLRLFRLGGCAAALLAPSWQDESQ